MGLGKSEKKGRIKRLLKDKHVDIVFFQETKQAVDSENVARKLWGYRNMEFMSVDPVGSAGGLLCIWDPSVFQLSGCCCTRRSFSFADQKKNYVYAYLNRADVQEALHANVTKLSYDWEPCSRVIRRWEDSPSTIIPLLQELMANGLRVWVFSGDLDGRLPVTSTKYSINKMKLHLKTPWHPWYLNGEVGGYTEVYKGDLTFATVRGAGHQVPSYQPARALSLIMHFLAGTPLPNSTTLLQ
ncbi:serine carboxypeptidase-like 40 [Camellia sinensis]|uniref:serine carboxypeptidase-like 40 n=1 Tax=Camellia sinensis TaxID=4442 RepID=UPI0010369AF6|nr:serine carboxypeptidase-like 40 [Camellia sinensis]